MHEIYVLRDNLNKWVAKYFKYDLISINDLINCIEDLDEELDRYKEKLEDLEQDLEDNYKPIKKSNQYDVSDCDFI